KITCDTSCLDPNRIGIGISSREVRAATAEQCEVGKRALTRSPIEIVRVTNRAGVEDRRLLAKQDQPIRVGIWQWPQQQRVDHAEDGGVGSDAERKSQDRGNGESGLFGKDSYCVPQMLHGSGLSARS